MSDATREQAIQWCKDKGCDFVTPVFPPPDGWIWGKEGAGLVLVPIFTTTDQGDDLTLSEVQGITHWASPEHSETITAELKAHNISLGGAPAAAVARYTIALGPITQRQAEQPKLVVAKPRTYADEPLSRIKAMGALVQDARGINISGDTRKVSAFLLCSAAVPELVERIEELEAAGNE